MQSKDKTNNQPSGSKILVGLKHVGVGVGSSGTDPQTSLRWVGVWRNGKILVMRRQLIGCIIASSRDKRWRGTWECGPSPISGTPSTLDPTSDDVTRSSTPIKYASPWPDSDPGLRSTHTCGQARTWPRSTTPYTPSARLIQPPPPSTTRPQTERQPREHQNKGTLGIGTSLISGLGRRLNKLGVDATCIMYKGTTIPHVHVLDTYYCNAGGMKQTLSQLRSLVFDFSPWLRIS